MEKLIHLTSANLSLVFKVERIPEIIYWGNKLSQLDDHILLATERPIGHSRLDVDVPMSICPELGAGYFNSPGLEGNRNGFDFAPVFSTTSADVSARAVRFELEDDIAQLQLSIEFTLDFSSDVLEKTLTLKNIGDDSYCVDNLAATLPLPYHAKELMTFHGRWCQEFQTQRLPLEQGGFIQENRRGRTSHENFPGLFAGSKGFNEESGDVWGFHLGWSGNHRLRADVRSDGRRAIQASELLFSGEVRVAPGESYTTPTLYATYSAEGLNGASHRFHTFVRRHILTLANEKVRPVHLNTWEGIYFDHDPDYIQKMATEAAELGVERFIIDDGWFVGRNGEKAALGDWYLDENKYPNGLEPVIHHINNLGMEFGLWVEPEMINKDSNLYRNNPEWLLGAQDYQKPSGRFQYVLNLQNQACFDYLLERLDDLLTRYNIGYLKWDMNRELVQPAHFDKAAVHGQTLALYRLIDTLRNKHPRVEIESCSSGGGRIDYEILKRTDRFWASDCNDALERQTIQRGMSYFFPSEVMGAHIGPAECHSTNRKHDINMRGLTALQGHMGVELDPVKETEQEKLAFAKYIDLHKQYRALIHSGQSFRLDASDNSQFIYGVKSEHEMLITVCQMAMPSYALPAPLRVSHADPQAQYLVQLIDLPNTAINRMRHCPGWIGGEIRLSGQTLKEVGITMPIIDPESALLLHISQI